MFDGHAGSRVSAHCARHLLDCIVTSEDFKRAIKNEGSLSQDEVFSKVRKFFVSKYSKLFSAILSRIQLETELCNNPKHSSKPATVLQLVILSGRGLQREPEGELVFGTLGEDGHPERLPGAGREAAQNSRGGERRGQERHDGGVRPHHREARPLLQLRRLEGRPQLGRGQPRARHAGRRRAQLSAETLSHSSSGMIRTNINILICLGTNFKNPESKFIPSTTSV